MAAAVRGAGLGVGVDMGGDGKRVHLTHESQVGAGGVLALEIGLDAGDGKPLLGLKPQRLYNLGEFAGCPEFPVSQLGMLPNITAKGNDFFLLFIDQLTNALFEFVHE